MKVLHVVDNLQHGGTELHVLKLTRALRRRGHEVSLLLIGEWGPLAKEYQADGVEIVRHAVGSFVSTRLLIRIMEIARYIDAVDPQVVHAHDIHSNLLVALVRGFCRGRRRWIASQRWGLPPSLAWRVASRVAFQRSDVVTANGAGTQQIARALLLSREKAVVTPNFLEHECFVPSAARESRRAALRREVGLQLDSGAVVLGSVGRLDPLKRVDWMLRAVGALRRDGLPAELVLVGDGPERARLERLSRSLQLDDHIHFLGARPRLPLSQIMFDVSLLSSSNEGVPNALIESFACGVPCVATDVGGVADIVRDSGGLLVGADDEAAFERAIFDLISNTALRQALGASGNQRARDQWHEDVVLPLVEDVYRATDL